MKRITYIADYLSRWSSISIEEEHSIVFFNSLYKGIGLLIVCLGFAMHECTIINNVYDGSVAKNFKLVLKRFNFKFCQLFFSFNMKWGYKIPSEHPNWYYEKICIYVQSLVIMLSVCYHSHCGHAACPVLLGNQHALLEYQNRNKN